MKWLLLAVLLSIGGGEGEARGAMVPHFCWNILAGKDQDTLIEQSATLIEQSTTLS